MFRFELLDGVRSERVIVKRLTLDVEEGPKPPHRHCITSHQPGLMQQSNMLNNSWERRIFVGASLICWAIVLCERARQAVRCV